MLSKEKYISAMNHSIKKLFYDALKINIFDLPKVFFLFKTIWWQKKAARTRLEWEARGTHVPPFMIASITSRCNLKCKGCYANAQHRPIEKEMQEDRLRRLFLECSELGLSIVLLAGGEPFVRKEILDITAEFPYIVFPVFTNGLLMTDDTILKLKRQKNVVPVISLEGDESDTDTRRGEGTYQKLSKIFKKLKQSRIFYAISLTVTNDNLTTITEEEYIQNLIDQGVKLFFYVEYVPVEEDTEDLVLLQKEREKLANKLDYLRSKFSALFISFPGDEEKFGGCLAAGRGFIHVSPEGNLEPCPFAPYSDTNLHNVSLIDSLSSGFLERIRENHDKLSETLGGCALWENRDWVQSLLPQKDKS